MKVKLLTIFLSLFLGIIIGGWLVIFSISPIPYFGDNWIPKINESVLTKYSPTEHIITNYHLVPVYGIMKSSRFESGYGYFIENEWVDSWWILPNPLRKTIRQ